MSKRILVPWFSFETLEHKMFLFFFGSLCFFVLILWWAWKRSGLLFSLLQCFLCTWIIGSSFRTGFEWLLLERLWISVTFSTGRCLGRWIQGLLWWDSCFRVKREVSLLCFATDTHRTRLIDMHGTRLHCMYCSETRINYAEQLHFSLLSLFWPRHICCRCVFSGQPHWAWHSIGSACDNWPPGWLRVDSWLCRSTCILIGRDSPC